ncbi:MAG: hypothetical protein QMD09_01555 [Desulfatibacillaceae bacterium]|nr:hypothetical protein [Desulfatibacillaceae bacterium]
MKPFSFFCLLFVLLLIGGALPAHASQVQIMDMEEMTRSAGLIFAGRCIGFEKVDSQKEGFSAIKTTFAVETGLKGAEAGQEISFCESFFPGAPDAKKGGQPPYRPGSSYLLFLHPISDSGLTSSVGMGQGVFLITDMPDGSPGAVNGLNNSNLDWAPLYQGPIPLDALFDRISFLIEIAP